MRATEGLAGDGASFAVIEELASQGASLFMGVTVVATVGVTMMVIVTVTVSEGLAADGASAVSSATAAAAVFGAGGASLSESGHKGQRGDSSLHCIRNQLGN